MGNGEDGTQNGVNWQILDCRSEILAGCGKSLNRDDSPPQGLKPSLVLHDLRGAKAPLYHSAAGFRDFFRSLLGVPDRTTLNHWSVMRRCVYYACGMTIEDCSG